LEIERRPSQSGEVSSLPEDARRALRQFGIEEIQQARRAGGTAGLNFRIRSSGKDYFLRRRHPKHSSLEKVRFDHRATKFLSCRGVKVEPPFTALTGESFALEGGFVYELTRFIRGVEFDRDRPDMLEGLAQALALFHKEGEAFPDNMEKTWPRLGYPPFLTESLLQLRKLARDRREKDALEAIARRVEGIAQCLPDSQFFSLPQTLIHGDIHPANVLFRGAEVAGFFDLDWMTRHPRMKDVGDALIYFAGRRKSALKGDDIYSLTESFQFDIERSLYFLRCYARFGGGIERDEFEALPSIMGLRWISARIEGSAKVPEEKRIFLVTREIFEPLDWLEDNWKGLIQRIGDVARD